tara:strand:+ start:370 stop:519 length:150 start_codon:yes stop_codon:yes gene_type:complete
MDKEKIFEEVYEELYQDENCKLQGEDFEHEVIRLAEIKYELLGVMTHDY